MESNQSLGGVSVIVPVHNAEGNIGPLIEALLAQTRIPDEILLVDDGSTDSSRHIIAGFVQKHACIRYFYQSNQGPASARNFGWKNASHELCAFTDDDCLPEKNWLQALLESLRDPSVAAVGGVYKTLKPDNPMANFVGLEFDYKYSKNLGDLDCHGTCNLAVRKQVLEEVGGFWDQVGRTSAEDWDLTYKITYSRRLVLQRRAVVGHYHPEKLGNYLKIQFNRARDRIFLYQKHPSKKGGDSYTNPWIPFHLTASLLFALVFPLYFFISKIPALAALQGGFFLASQDPGLSAYLFKKAPKLGLWGWFVQFFRNFAWLLGIVVGYLLVLQKKSERSIENEDRRVDSMPQ